MIECFTTLAKYQRCESVILSNYNITFFGEIGNFTIGRICAFINNNSFCSIFFNRVGVVADNYARETTLFCYSHGNIYNWTRIGINYYFHLKPLLSILIYLYLLGRRCSFGFRRGKSILNRCVLKALVCQN